MINNAESRFAENPISLDMPRSTFDRSCGHKTTWDVGELIPVFFDGDVLPGDTWNMKVASAVRMQTLLKPPMDNLYMDTYFFFVPYRLVWQHWKEFMGENTTSAWIPSVSYTIPQITAPSGGWNVGTLADYFGIPVGIDDISVSDLPFRAYAAIVNDWFRSEALQDPPNIPVTDGTVAGSNGTNYITDLVKGGAPFTVCKYFDYFTGCLPSPQKGPDVLIPSGSVTNLYPVVTGSEFIDTSLFPTDTSGNPYSFSFKTKYNGNWQDPRYQSSNTYFGNGLHTNGSGSSSILYNSQTTAFTDPPVVDGQNGNSLDMMIPANLYAIGSGGLGASINQLRTAFAIQRFYEAQARGGSRYTEMIREFFRVVSPDARLQRPEYLGGSRRMININQVIQQSSTDATSPQGNLSGVSLTTDNIDGFTKSFTEHGCIIGLVCVRYDHTYQQGIERHWSRKSITDFYWPTFANLSEQPVLNKEIFAQGSTVLDPLTGEPFDEEVFGYQEAWADYRYKPSRVSGEMRSAYTTSLDSWHFGDDYASLPVLSDSWIREDKNPVDRALAVQSSVSNQFFGDFYFKLKCTRCMPVYSVPGLIDHH